MNRQSPVILGIVMGMLLAAIPSVESNPIVGVGATSCGKWIDMRSKRDFGVDIAFVSWIQGFLSGMNTQRSNLKGIQMSMIPDNASLLAYVDKGCKENPLTTVFEISNKLYTDIQ